MVAFLVTFARVVGCSFATVQSPSITLRYKRNTLLRFQNFAWFREKAFKGVRAPFLHVIRAESSVRDFSKTRFLNDFDDFIVNLIKLKKFSGFWEPQTL